MKFSDIFKTIGVGLLSSNPVGASILGAVNMFLPDDKKLPEGSTGEQVKNAVEKLPPEQQASLMEKEIDLEIAKEEGWSERYIAMTKADGQSTRPKIALMMAQILSFEILAFTVVIAWSVSHEGMAALNQPYLWTIFGTLTSVPAGILAKYYGELRKEQSNRIGVKQDDGLISKLLGMVKK